MIVFIGKETDEFLEELEQSDKNYTKHIQRYDRYITKCFRKL